MLITINEKTQQKLKFWKKKKEIWNLIAPYLAKKMYLKLNTFPQRKLPRKLYWWILTIYERNCNYFTQTLSEYTEFL